MPQRTGRTNWEFLDAYEREYAEELEDKIAELVADVHGYRGELRRIQLRAGQRAKRARADWTVANAAPPRLRDVG